jgi:hypothetical protein
MTPAFLFCIPLVLASTPTLLIDKNVVFVGRVQKAADGTVSFDMNGVEVKTTVTGTTGLFASMSQIQQVQGNVFQVYLDGVLQPNSRFNTSKWVAGQVVKVPLFTGLASDSNHTVSIFKDTEPQFAGTTVQPNYITFHGFSGDSSARLVAPAAQVSPLHKIEFLGDSITAGFDNLCDVPGSPKGFPWSESFARSWATGICNTLKAECHYNAWSGFGMVANCCGGSTLGSDVWTRTLATVGSTNTSDPHGTTAENTWDFSKWIADAVVINLGTNDHLGESAPTTGSSALEGIYKPSTAGPIELSSRDPVLKKCYVDSAQGPVTYVGGNIFGDKHLTNHTSSADDCCALCQQYASKNCTFWQYDTNGCYGHPAGCCRLKNAQAWAGRSTHGPATTTSGSIKPLPPPSPSPKSKAFVLRYEALVVAAAKAYGSDTRFFLACGPMTTDFCEEVDKVIASVSAMGIKAYLLDQVGFESGKYGKDCAYGHPGSQDDVAMAKNGSAFIKMTMGW